MMSTGKKAPFVTLDVFTTKRFRGNQVAIVKLEDPLPDISMQMIAREFNLSETVFLRQENDGALKINIFTPVNEMDFAGHPVIGVGHALFQRLVPGIVLIPAAVSEITVLTKAGPVALHRDLKKGTVRAEIPHNVHIHATLTTKQQLLITQPGLQDRALEMKESYPTISIVKGVTYSLVDFTNQDSMFAAITAGPSQILELDEGWAPSFTGMMYYRASEPFVENETRIQKLRVRMIAINLEDPACGSGSCALGAFLALQHGKPSGIYRFDIDQGSEIQRDSTITVEVILNGVGDCISTISLAGPAAAPVLEGTLFLPE